ncbi:NUDIX hydrolase [Micrococcus sp.]|uniref:NUDIX hydrolase n=1 Tax=Micrococcus sp. TaxID=1271 RepID=UPI0026DC0C4F|nr:NUDIX hydrolase [Micrococcus sp.]MDO4238954.1 NUDIX hydrolase [Micrococcus sp.]
MSADAADRVPVPSHEEELTRQWLAQRHRQVRPARPASAVVLVRDGADGVEVLLRHRAGRTPLGRVGFPGGSLVESDAHPCPWFGPSPGEWAHALGLADRRRVRQHVVAAVRELFEESGVLLAGASDMEVVQDARGETWGARRSSLEHGDAGLPQLLDDRGLGLRTDLLRALGRWQSAPHSPRRFDTVVFAAALPPQQEPVPRPDGPDLQGWLSARRLLVEPLPLPGPAGWLGEGGRVALAEVSTPLTQLVLRDVARHRTAAGFLLSLGHGRDPVPHVRLRTEVEGDDVATGTLHTVAEAVARD